MTKTQADPTPTSTPAATAVARRPAARATKTTSALDISPDLEEHLQEVLAHAQRFGTALRDTVLHQRPEDADRLVETAVDSTQRLFAKWKLEILYSLTLTESARFSELRRRLGTISSRTLSNKLKELEEDGYLQRTVTTTRPLRVDYTPTPQGLRVAALTTPLIAYLNHHHTPEPAATPEDSHEA